MKNSIVVCAEFDFKGETFRPRLVLDLDQLMERDGTLPTLIPLLARANAIDPYSYQYEVLESTPLTFTEATGAATDYLEEGRFDIAGFEHHWHEQRQLQQLQAIAERCLGVSDLTEEPALKEALKQAFLLGSQTGKQ